MVEEAALDRNLFQSSRPSQHVDLNFPEWVLDSSLLLAGLRSR